VTLLPRGAEIRQVTNHGDPAELVDACRDADAVITDYVRFDRAVLSQMTRCRVVSVAATGWDRIDIVAARELGISVCCVGEYCTGEVADHTMALMLALNRRLLNYHAQVQQDKSWAYDRVGGIRRLAGQTLGIVGMGRIGRAVAKRARGFGLSIIGHDPFLPEAQAPGDIPMAGLGELLERSDIISLHCNLVDENRALIHAGAFNHMHRRPLLINVARGGLVDEKALVGALDSGNVAGAALDVLADEPPGLEGHPLAGRDDVILTPHVAFYSDQSLQDCRRISAANIRHFFAGRPDEVFRFVHHAS
jgi:D-3-phosphoglycerate dehydrogenase